MIYGSEVWDQDKVTINDKEVEWSEHTDGKYNLRGHSPRRILQ